MFEQERQLKIQQRLAQLGCPNGIQQEAQFVGFLRENLTNTPPENARQNLKHLREGYPAEDNFEAIPPTLNPKLEQAIRNGEAGESARVFLLAGYIQAREEITLAEREFVVEKARNDRQYNLGAFTWGR